MSIGHDSLAELAALVSAPRVMPDSGIDYIFLPGLKIAVGDEERVLDALLCPVQHVGYTTRLFLAEPIPQRGQNWTVHNILGRTWHTWSWNNVPSSLSPMKILSAHLGALR
ncbi:hypothetical protein [Noviherbaspirillum malthae]|uniref:hypothetical protein n=1 Tax=Noviherbaspirillum malthae TaxID=1260987 RepID=UPI002B278A64|nr:hypothetical protein [Noviherbaspirillum malthae]